MGKSKNISQGFWFLIAVLSLLLMCFQIQESEKQIKRRKEQNKQEEEQEEPNREWLYAAASNLIVYELSHYRLVYGEWEIIEYVEIQSGNSEGAKQIGKKIEFNPKFLKVDDRKVEGDVFILCNAIGEDAIGEFLGELFYPNHKEAILKVEKADFYTVAKIMTKPDMRSMNQLREAIPGEGYHIFVKDTDTLILICEEGYYRLNRTGYIDGVEEEELRDYMGSI